MQKASVILFASAAIAAALCSSSTIHAQTAAKPASINCVVRKSPMTPGDIAFAQDDYAKAIDLYREESKATGPEGDRAHAAMIRAMLRANKVHEAELEVHDWQNAAPKDIWTKVALGEVQWRQGNVADAVPTMQSVIQTDFCNAQAHADYAHVLALTGMSASAQSQLGIARRLDPVDDEIEGNWMMMLQRQAMLPELTSYLQRPYLTDKQRKAFEKVKDVVSKPTPPSCRLAGTVRSNQLPLKIIQAGPESPMALGLEVYLNGKLRHLEVDTGASGLLLTKGAVDALHLEPEAHVKTGGIGDSGPVDSFTAKVSTIKIGDLQFDDCQVRVLEKTPPLLYGKDGLMGGDVFRAFLLTLDFPGRMLKLDPLPPVPSQQGSQDAPSLETDNEMNSALHDRYIDPSMASWTKILRSGHDVLVPVRINGGPIRFFIVDTGGHVDLISTDAARGVAKVTEGVAGNLRGISGNVDNLSLTGPLKLEFAGLTYPTPGMTAIDTTSMARGFGLEIGGLLGTNILHQLTIRIDYRDDLVNFSYDPKRLAGCVQGVTKVDCY